MNYNMVYSSYMYTNDSSTSGWSALRMCQCNTKHTKSLGKCGASIEATGWPILTNTGTEMIHGPHVAAPAWPGWREGRGVWVVALLVPGKTYHLGEKYKIKTAF